MRLFKRLMSILLLNILMFSSNTFVKATSNSELKSGIYSLQNDIYHSSETGRSMARTYLNPNMKMEIRNGQVYFIVKFSGAQYMENFRMIVDGGGVNVSTIDKNTAADTVTLKFKGNSPSSKITAKIYVGPMGRDVSFNIIPKLETANLIKAIEEPKKEAIKKDIVKEEVPNKQKEEKVTEKISNDEEKKEVANKENINNKLEEVIKNNNEENKKDNNEENNKKDIEKNKKENSLKEEKVNNFNKEEKSESKEEIKDVEGDKLEQHKKELEASNKSVTVSEEVKDTIYERLNKKVIIVSLAIVCIIVGGTIFAIKKFKKQYK